MVPRRMSVARLRRSGGGSTRVVDLCIVPQMYISRVRFDTRDIHSGRRDYSHRVCRPRLASGAARTAHRSTVHRTVSPTFADEAEWEGFDASASHLPSSPRLRRGSDRSLLDSPLDCLADVRALAGSESGPAEEQDLAEGSVEAEWEGFEPSRRVDPAYTISSRAPSASSDTTPRCGAPASNRRDYTG